LARWAGATENQVGLAIRAIVKVNLGKSMIDDVTVVEQTRKFHRKIVLGVQKMHSSYFHNFDNHKWERLYWYMTLCTVITVAA